MVENKIICEVCGGSDIFIDMKDGELICKNCGIVLTNHVYWKNEIYDK